MHTHTGLLSPQSSRIRSKKLHHSKSRSPIEVLCWLHTSLTLRFLCYQSLFLSFGCFWLVAFFRFIFFFPNSLQMVFGENPVGCSSCPCISKSFTDMLTPTGHREEQMANIQKHLVHSTHTPATQAWKETPESSREKPPSRAGAGDRGTSRPGFKAGQFVAAAGTAMASHFSCQPPHSSS